jgi:hypothetical protein
MLKVLAMITMMRYWNSMNKVKTHINFDNFGKGKFKYLPPDAYVIQHPFILSNFKLLQINKSYIFITSGVYDPVI